MRSTNSKLGLVATLALVTGCTSGQTNNTPGVTPIVLTQNKAQIAVGVATFTNGSTGLNVVETFRQPNGLSATLLNTPTITGPAGFVVPAGNGGIDGGTNHISGSLQVPPGGTAVASTFGTKGGAFAYGFAPENVGTSGSANFGLYSGAFYDATGALTGADSTGTPIVFEGGPPAYPNTQTGTYPSGFTGFTQGFTTFATTPVVGAYGLSIVIPSSSSSTTITAQTANLTTTTGLGAVTKPTFTQDGAGGGTATCTAPAGTTEVLVDLTDVTAGHYYTVVVPGSGAISATFASNLGSTAGAAGTTKPTIQTGDEYSVSCIAVDYPAFEAGPPGNTQQLPTIVGANGQADISFSPNFDVTAY